MKVTDGLGITSARARSAGLGCSSSLLRSRNSFISRRSARMRGATPAINDVMTFKFSVHKVHGEILRISAFALDGRWFHVRLVPYGTSLTWNNTTTEPTLPRSPIGRCRCAAQGERDASRPLCDAGPFRPARKPVLPRRHDLRRG